jgi:hypothetical protein
MTLLSRISRRSTEVEMLTRSSWRRSLAALAAALGSLAFLAPAAQAGPLVASAPSCDNLATSQPFLPWADPASYVLDPGGSFENGASGWSLSGGASVASGNESYKVGGSGDSYSLSLPSGSSATSSTVCVGIEHPDLRVFVRNTGSMLSTLRVDVLFEDAYGNVQSAPIGTVSGGSSWQPSAQIPILVNLLPLLPGDHTPVAFRFTPQGSNGSWSIDDTYVDPWGGR